MKQNKLIFWYLLTLIPLGIGSVLLHAIYVFVFQNIFFQILNYLYSSIESIYGAFTVFIIVYVFYKKLPKLYLLAPITYLILAGLVGLIVGMIFGLYAVFTENPELIINIISNPLFFAYNVLIYAIQIPIHVFLLVKFKYLRF